MTRARFPIALLAGALSASCGKGLTTETGECVNVAGHHTLSYGDACGRFGHGAGVDLTQSGCAFSGRLPGIGTLRGTFVKESADIRITLEGTCAGEVKGVATLSGSTLSATYAGPQTGTGCCANVVGQFTLSR